MLSRVWLFVTPWTVARQASLSITNSRSLLKLMSIELVMPSSHLILLPSPPTFNLSQYQVLFKWISPSHQVAKVLEFQLQHQSSEYIGFSWISKIVSKLIFYFLRSFSNVEWNYFKINLYWSIVDLYCCVSFRYIAK